jgi:hypothetical protein
MFPEAFLVRSVVRRRAPNQKSVTAIRAYDRQVSSMVGLLMLVRLHRLDRRVSHLSSDGEEVAGGTDCVRTVVVFPSNRLQLSDQGKVRSKSRKRLNETGDSLSGSVENAIVALRIVEAVNRKSRRAVRGTNQAGSRDLVCAQVEREVQWAFSYPTSS